MLLPAVSAVFLENEGFHFYMVMMVLPISSFALWTGFKQHASSKILLPGIMGLIILSITVFLGHEQLGELTEKLLTLFGSSFICYSHYHNYKICQQQDSCDCHYYNVAKQEESINR